jgi:predicted aldo/keto reductase-like oxidoreductase
MGRKDAFEGDYHQVKGHAALCIQCAKCEEKCPQKIRISEWLPIVHRVLGEGQSYASGTRR